MFRTCVKLGIVGVLLVAQCTAFARANRRVVRCVNYANTHPKTYILFVQLTAAQVVGNPPIDRLGLHVKEAVAIKKRVYTRAYLELRGHSDRIIRGSGAKALITFDIDMGYLLAFPGPTGVAIEPPASNIPDLVIGDQYLIMKSEESSGNLLFDCIFAADSTEGYSILGRLKKPSSGSETQNHDPDL